MFIVQKSIYAKKALFHLAPAASRFSIGWASSARIWTEESSLMVTEPEETKNFLLVPSSS